MDKVRSEFIALHKRQRENTRILDPRFQVQRHHLFIRYIGPNSSVHSNGVVFTNFDAMTRASVEDCVRSQVIFFQNLRRSFRWKHLDYDLPSYLPEILEAESLKVSATDTLMALECKEKLSLQSIPGIEIRELTDVETFKDIAPIQIEVWKEDPTSLVETLQEEKLADPSSLRMLVAYDNNEPVCCAWVRFDRYFGTLLGGSTRAKWRGKGIYAQMVKMRANMANEKALRFVTVDAGPMSAPLLEKLGFFPAAVVKRYEKVYA